MKSGNDYLKELNEYVSNNLIGLRIKTSDGIGKIYKVYLTEDQLYVQAESKKFDMHFRFGKFEFIDEPPPLPK